MSEVPKIEKLGNVAEFIRGITFKPTDVVPFGATNSIPCFRTKNVQSEIDLSDILALPAAFSKKAEKLVQEGDLLVSTANSWNIVGKCCWVPNLPWDATIGGFIAALRPLRSKIEPRYLYRWFSREETQARIRSCARQTTNIANLSIDQCLALELPLPALDEQRRIAAILDQADILRRKRQEAADLASVFLHSAFRGIFGAPEDNPLDWPICPVGDLTDCIVPGRDKPKSFTGKTPWVTTSDLVHLGETFHSRSGAGLSEGEISSARARIIPADSVVITCVGDLGVASIAKRPMVINQQLHAFQCKTDILPEYLVFAVSYQKSYMTNMASSTTLPYMNKAICNSIPIALPSMDRQIQFRNIFKYTSNILNLFKDRDRNLNELFASLQHRAFAGEL